MFWTGQGNTSGYAAAEGHCSGSRGTLPYAAAATTTSAVTPRRDSPAMQRATLLVQRQHGNQPARRGKWRDSVEHAGVVDTGPGTLRQRFEASRARSAHAGNGTVVGTDPAHAPSEGVLRKSRTTAEEKARPGEAPLICRTLAKASLRAAARHARQKTSVSVTGEVPVQLALLGPGTHPS